MVAKLMGIGSIATVALAVATCVLALIVGTDPAWDTVGESFVAATFVAALGTAVAGTVRAGDAIINRAVARSARR